MHCSDSLLVSYSFYMFRRMYVIIRESTFLCPAELYLGGYGCIIHVKESIHPVVVVYKTHILNKAH
jgi:hypothetical protein